MQAPDDIASAAPAPAAAKESGQADALSALAREGAAFVRNLLELVAGETALARMSLQRLLIAALIVPAVILAAWFALNALLAAALARWLHDWIAAIAIVLAFDVAVVVAFGFAMRRWWRDLSLPRSRAAIARLLERPR